MAAAPAEGGAGAALLAATIGLLALLAYYAVRGILAGWQATIGRAFLWLAEALTFNIPTGFTNIHVSLGGPFKAVNNAVVGWLGAFAEKLDGYAGLFFHGSAVLVEWTAREIQNTTTAVLHWGGWIAHVFVPTYVHGVTDVWKTLTHTATKVVHLTETRVIHLTKVIRVEANHAAKVIVPDIAVPYPKDWEWIHKHWKALVAAVAGGLAWPGGISIPWPHVNRWFGLTKKQIVRLERRMRRVEGLLGAAGMAAVMANALGLPNWRCITRGNLGRVSRAICGLSATALEDLLGLLVDALILVNVCEVITLMTEAFALIETPLADWIETAADQFIHCGYDLPGQLPDPTLSLPPVTGVTLSLAA